MVQNPIVWEVRITGNVNFEVIIQYQEVVNSTYGVVDNRHFHYLNTWGTERDYYYTGASLWQILNQTGVLKGNSTQYYFSCYDNYVTEKLWLSDIEANPDYVLIAFKKGSEFLKPKSEGGEGPLRAIVDFNLTDPGPNSEYWAMYVNEIIIV